MAQVFPSRAQALYEEGKVSVISHRGDWRNTPENSIRAIQNCIDLGVNMVEIDIKKTKDNELILLHDKTLDRTTTGKGLPQDYTLAEIKQMRLRNGAGVATSHQIPTLEEAMIVAKGKIWVKHTSNALGCMFLMYSSTMVIASGLAISMIGIKNSLSNTALFSATTF